MKRPVGKKTERKHVDAQVEEFERRDLGDDIKRSGATTCRAPSSAG